MEGFESIVGVDFWTALFTLLNMLVTFALLGKFLFKPVKKMIDDRKSEVDKLYSDADEAKEEANALRAEYEAKLEGAKAERDDILRKAVRNGWKTVFRQHPERFPQLVPYADQVRCVHNPHQGHHGRGQDQHGDPDKTFLQLSDHVIAPLSVFLLQGISGSPVHPDFR